ncbi:MAG: DegT/DnrJ/EryC1/StrS family aminotransferase, partial [Egibacteraceae bacterium]
VSEGASIGARAVVIAGVAIGRWALVGAGAVVTRDVADHALVVARHGLALLEDGSHAHGASVAARKVGTFGTAAAFSLNGPKPLSAGEGGFALTDDEEIYYRLLLHGHYNKRCRTEIPVEHPLAAYAVTGMGLKFRIHPLAAAIALDQLSRLDTYLERRRRIAARMLDGLRGLPGLAFPDIPDDVEPAWYGLCLQYRSEELDGLPIEDFTAALHAEGCAELDQPSSTCPLNLHPLFQNSAPLFPDLADWPRYAPGDFPVAEHVHRQTLKLPVWHRDSDVPLADAYVTAFTKVVDSYTHLLRKARTA